MWKCVFALPLTFVCTRQWFLSTMFQEVTTGFFFIMEGNFLITFLIFHFMFSGQLASQGFCCPWMFFSPFFCTKHRTLKHLRNHLVSSCPSYTHLYIRQNILWLAHAVISVMTDPPEAFFLKRTFLKQHFLLQQAASNCFSFISNRNCKHNAFSEMCLALLMRGS